MVGWQLSSLAMACNLCNHSEQGFSNGHGVFVLRIAMAGGPDLLQWHVEGAQTLGQHVGSLADSGQPPQRCSNCAWTVVLCNQIEPPAAITMSSVFVNTWLQ